MVYDGLRYVEAAMPGELGPEAHITVLAIGEEVLVEQSYLLEQRPPVERCRRARPEDEGRLIVLPPVQLPVPEPVGQTATPEGVPCAVQHATVVEVHQLARKQARLRVALCRVHQRL